MPNKQKKGGGKTEEEKLLYLQGRAQAEEQMAKKKEELLTLFLKDKLQKEQRNTALNLLKLDEGWRTIFRQTRAAELRTERDIHTQTFERQLENLDSVIKSLERSLQDAERHSAQVCSTNLQHLERLGTQQDKRLASLLRPWQRCLRDLSSRFGSEREQMLAHHQRQLADLHDAMFTVEQQHEDMKIEMDKLRAENVALYESADGDRRPVLAPKDQEKLKERTVKYQQARQLFEQEAKELDHMVKMNETYRQREETMERTIKKQQELVTQHKKELSSFKTDETVDQDMRGARNEVKKNTHKLRNQLIQDGKTARIQLTALTIQTDNAAKKVQEVIDKGERLLRVAEICKKLESNQENIFTSLAAENQRQERPGTEKDEVAKEIPEFPELRQVMLHINASLLYRAALRKEREDLSQENQNLRLLLRQHLDGMTVSDGALDGRHALLTIHQAPTTVALPDTTRHHTVIEAVHAIKHSL